MLKRKIQKVIEVMYLSLMSNQRESPEEQLWERNRKERKETNRKPSTKNWKIDMRDQVEKKGESE